MTPTAARRFRVAVLSVPKHSYLPLAAAAHPRFELVVVADDASQPDWVHERNARFAAEQNIPYVRDVARALTAFGADVAVVSSQVDRHCDLAVRAADAGLHVIIDKPMGVTLAECDRAVTAVERRGVRFLMWNRSTLPALLQTRAAIARGDVGALRAVHIDFYFAKDAGPPLGSRQPGEPPRDWLAHQIAAHAAGADGGLAATPVGELSIEGVYPLAYLWLLTGAAVRRVWCRAATQFHQVYADNGVEDIASLTLELEHGILATIAVGRIGASSHPDLGEIKLHVLGAAGALVVGESRPEVGVYYRGQPAAEFRQRRVGSEGDFVLLQDFAEAIDAGRPTMLDVRASRAIMATVMAALESAHTGRAVALP